MSFPKTLTLALLCLPATLPATPPTLLDTPSVATPPSSQLKSAFGTDAQSVLSVSALTGMPVGLSADSDWNVETNLYRHATMGSPSALANVNLPTGALIDSIELEACDTSDAARAVGGILACGPTASDPCSVLDSSTDIIDTGIPEMPGCDRFQFIYGTPLTVDNLNYAYHFIFEHSTAAGVSFRSARIFWRRQISPAPGSATFGDVPTSHPFFQHVEALAASGITAGCGDGDFCPGDPLTRGQMAVFLAKALGLHWPN